MDGVIFLGGQACLLSLRMELALAEGFLIWGFGGW